LFRSEAASEAYFNAYAADQGVRPASPYISHYPLTKGCSLTPKHMYEDMFR
jgi:hypothetical protein